MGRGERALYLYCPRDNDAVEPTGQGGNASSVTAGRLAFLAQQPLSCTAQWRSPLQSAERRGVWNMKRLGVSSRRTST